MSGHSHSHSHSHAVSAAGKHRSRLIITFALVAGFFVIELLAALDSGSLALLGDAGHMAADVVTLGAALLAVHLAPRQDKFGRRTFGNYRVEVFASGLAVLIMLAVAVFITIEAIGRFGHAPEPASGTMLAVGILGLVVNIIGILMLRGGSAESLNIKGAYLEVLADALGSVGVIVAAVLVGLTGSSWWDTIIALGIAVFIAVRAAMLGREVLRVLAQSAPPGVEPAEIQAALESLPGMAEVHDLHVWQLTSGMDVISAHIVTTRPDTMLAAQRLLRDDFGISHITLQSESASREECDHAGW
ncbi:cation diffusion facilitator family transporter [Brooklawnia sp.]|uniref:cation diffusion facilitator family transporter n=1 Tax=Brooklawnia sp. TaxID=2699740 RepID=UPI00311FB9B0